MATQLEADYRVALKTYDNHLTEHPLDATAAMERCLFVEDAANGGEYGKPYFAEAPAQAEKCRAGVLQRYGDLGVVRLFHMERLYGEEAVAFGVETLELEGVTWGGDSLARFNARLAWGYFNTEQVDSAVEHANTAIAGDDELDAQEDVSVILGTHYKDKGERSVAVAFLSRPTPTAYGHRKVQLLVGLRAFSEALALIERLKQAEVTIGDQLRAEALEGAGDTVAAKAIYEEMAGSAYNKGAAYERLFRIELAGGHRDRAVRAYETMRDEGLSADPFGRHRIDLSLAWPTARWHARDLLGFLCLAALMLGVILLPGLWIVPIHYIGLVRKRQDAPRAFADGWSIKHFWLASWAVLLPGVLATYIFVPEELESWFLDYPVEHTYERASVANLGIMAFTLSFALVAMVVRREDLADLLHSQWSVRRVTAVVIASLVGIGLINLLTGITLHQMGFDLADMVGSVVVTSELTTLDILRSVAHTYGSVPLILMIAVMVPLLEEFAFRGVFLSVASRHIPFAWANALQATLFMLAHDNAVHLPALFVLGLVTGLMRKRSGGLAPAIALHGSMNLIAGIAIMARLQ